MKDFLFTLLAWLLTLPCIVGAVGFALYNPQSVTVTLSPFRSPAELPLYVPVLGAIAIGFLFGALMTWAAMGRLRKERREHRKKIKALEKQIEVANQNQTPASIPTLLPSSFVDKQ